MIEKVKNKLNNLFNGDYRGIAILFVLEFILCITIKPILYDDAAYIQAFTLETIFGYVSRRYMEWTSRVLIETTLGIIFKCSGYLWKIGNILLMTLIGYSMSKLFVKKENKKELNMMVLWLCILYPFERMSSAGWAATTVNYIWPLALGLYSCISIRKAWNKEKIDFWPAVWYSLALTFGCNQELCCGVLFITYALFTLLLIIRDKEKFNKYMILQTSITIASFVFVITAPGNNARKLNEVLNYFPDYFTLTIVEKLIMGVTSTMGEILVNGSITFLALSFISLVYIWSNHKDRLVRGISAVPFTACLALSFLSPIVEPIFSSTLPRIRDNFQKDIQLITPNNYIYLGSYIEFIISMVVIFCMILSLMLIFKKAKNFLPIYIFGAGIVSRLVLAFSPTIFISENRTFVIMEFACLICALLVWQEFIKNVDKKLKTKTYNCIVWASILEYITTLAFVMITHIGV